MPIGAKRKKKRCSKMKLGIDLMIERNRNSDIHSESRPRISCPFSGPDYSVRCASVKGLESLLPAML